MAQATHKGTGAQARESVEQIWLAGLGALALTEEEGSKFFRSLVKKGEVVERRSRARVEGTVTAAKGAASVAVSKIERGVDNTMENVMHRLGVPTRREITGLTRRIEGLTKSMEKKPLRARKTTALPRTRRTTMSESDSGQVS